MAGQFKAKLFVFKLDDGLNRHLLVWPEGQCAPELDLIDGDAGVVLARQNMRGGGEGQFEIGAGRQIGGAADSMIGEKIQMFGRQAALKYPAVVVLLDAGAEQRMISV